jgi:putative membrane protein
VVFLSAAPDLNVVGWPLDPTVYAGLVTLFIGHAWLARGCDLARIRSLYFGLGVLCLWLALETPIDTVSSDYLDSVHMVQHVLLGVIAPPLLLLGLNEPMAARVASVPGVRLLTAPVPAQLVAGTVMVGWHVPALYNATLYSYPMHALEHLTFIAGGLLFWWPVLSATGLQSGSPLSPGARLLYLLVGTLPQDGVALALQFSRTPFYDFYTHAPRLIPGLDAVTDQTIAGVVLQLFGKSSFLVAGLVIFFRWFSQEMAADHGRGDEGHGHVATGSG